MMHERVCLCVQALGWRIILLCIYVVEMNYMLLEHISKLAGLSVKYANKRKYPPVTSEDISSATSIPQTSKLYLNSSKPQQTEIIPPTHSRIQHLSQHDHPPTQYTEVSANHNLLLSRLSAAYTAGPTHRKAFRYHFAQTKSSWPRNYVTREVYL